MQGIDSSAAPLTPSGFDAFVSAAATAGYSCLWLYLTTLTHPAKVWTPARLASTNRLMEAGFYFEEAALQALGGAAQGTQDAAKAAAALSALGLPRTQPVAYCVDPDPHDVTAAQMPAVFAYFQALQANGVLPWAYCTIAVGEALLNAGLITGYIECEAYSGNVVSPRAAAFQDPGGKGVTVAGTSCDLLNILKPDHGQYPRPKGGIVQTVKAYVVDFHLYSWIPQNYLRGAEPEQPIGGPQPDILLSDCSGAQLEALRLGGVNLVTAFGTARPTADVFWDHSSPLPVGAKPGPNCYAFHPPTLKHPGTATHIIKAVQPYPFTIESGDGTGHTARHTVAWQNAKGCAWGTLNGVTFDNVKAADDPAFKNPWPVMGKGYVGYHARLLKSVLNQIQAAGLTISYSTTGNTVGASTVAQIKRFQTNHGLTTNGVCDSQMVKALHTALGL